MTDAAADTLQTVASRVQSAFERVHRESMTGLPFVNEALRVELVGLRPWRGLSLGVLVTPWCMNLLLLPDDGHAGAQDGADPPARWPQLATGEYAQFAFPGGVMSFLAGRDGEAGEYLSCSLFSPVFEFADHAGARQMAEACLLALLDPDAAASQAATAAPRPAAGKVDKRDFLRGRWRLPASSTSPMER